MQKYIAFALFGAICLASPQGFADGLEEFQQETNTLWSPSDKGAKDTSQDGQIATSMLAWGVGLTVVIGIVFGLIKSYNNSSTSSN